MSELKKIIFKDITYDSIICLGGNLPDKHNFSLYKDSVVIAADSGALKLSELDIIPEYIVGDLDSIDELSYSDKKVQIVKDESQEANDFEKAVLFAKSLGHRNILVVGINGGDYEHSLNNWSVFIKLSKAINLIIADNNRTCMSCFNSISMEAQINELISIIPQPRAVLTTKNLLYPLRNEALELGVREGARNKSIAEEFSITLHEGEFLLFFDERHSRVPILE